MKDLKASIEKRGRLGLHGDRVPSWMALHLGPRPSPEEIAQAVRLHKNLGLLQMYEGQFEDAAASFEKAHDLARSARMPAQGSTT